MATNGDGTATRAWRRFQGLTQLGWPRRFPIAQFPNLPLIVAVGAGVAHHFIAGTTARYLRAIAYVALGIWAYEEVAQGSNWFRRLLGATFLVIVVVRVARDIHGYE
ncbi:MAG TPA: hypothetical protein VHC43_00565 [Mycobacteriales bacterium]|nr:hypothetical protein [Mycobacteriales bacterium]